MNDLLAITLGLLLQASSSWSATSQEHANKPINPFGPKTQKRADALPGYVELSDGSLRVGRIYLTRDSRLKLYDEKEKRQREIPLRVIHQIETEVHKEWMEKEWRFKENANDQKVFTGRQYPTREYRHTITMGEKRTIQGRLSAVIYIQSLDEPSKKPIRLFLHKRHKGPIGSSLQNLVYVRSVRLGDKAVEEATLKLEKLRKSNKQNGGSNQRQPQR